MVIAVFIVVCKVLPSYKTSLSFTYGVPSLLMRNLVTPETVASSKFADPDEGAVIEIATEPAGGVNVLPVVFQG